MRLCMQHTIPGILSSNCDLQQQLMSSTTLNLITAHDVKFLFTLTLQRCLLLGQRILLQAETARWGRYLSLRKLDLLHAPNSSCHTCNFRAVSSGNSRCDRLYGLRCRCLATSSAKAGNCLRFECPSTVKEQKCPGTAKPAVRTECTVIEHPKVPTPEELGQLALGIELDEKLVVSRLLPPAGYQHRQRPASLQMQDRCSTRLPNNAVTALQPTRQFQLARIETYST